MAWIESHQALLNHRKTGRLVRRLGIAKVAAIGHLHCLWWWSLDNAPTGDLTNIDHEDIADGALWEGDPREFVDALIYAGYVDGPIERPYLHDWDEYAGKLIEKRTSDAERKRESRRKPKETVASEERPQDVQRTDDGHPSDGAGTVPNTTIHNTTNQEDPPLTPPAAGEMAAARPVRAAPKPKTLTAEQQGYFQRWYDVYPRHEKRPEAESAFRRLGPTPALVDRMIADVERRKRGRKWAEGYIELPATYLNQRIWEDDIEPPKLKAVPWNHPKAAAAQKVYD